MTSYIPSIGVRHTRLDVRDEAKDDVGACLQGDRDPARSSPSTAVSSSRPGWKSLRVRQPRLGRRRRALHLHLQDLRDLLLRDRLRRAQHEHLVRLGSDIRHREDMGAGREVPSSGSRTRTWSRSRPRPAPPPRRGWRLPHRSRSARPGLRGVRVAGPGDPLAGRQVDDRLGRPRERARAPAIAVWKYHSGAPSSPSPSGGPASAPGVPSIASDEAAGGPVSTA